MNYQLKLEEIIKSLDGKTPKLLLHACCGPCSSYCIEYLSNYFDITILYYNPNIYPENEYYRRLNELKTFLPKRQYKNKVNVIEDVYEPKEYYEAIRGKENLGEKSERCYECYKLRMEKAALYAKNNNYDYFTTTLSISPYKVSEWINEIGKNLEEKYNINYLYSDFKKNNGYKRSQELSKIYGMYRQDYCGCSFSKNERDNYEKKKLENLFKKVIEIYSLGSLNSVPVQNTIGITNKVFELETENGKYILKILSNKDLNKINISEKISSIANNNNVPSIPAIKINDNFINNIDGFNVIVYPYYDGKILLSRELTLEHIKLLSNSLARLHSINVLDNKLYKKYEKEDLYSLYQLTLNSNESFYDLFKENINLLINIYDKVYDSYSRLSNQRAYVHKDFNRKNVLWKDYDYKIIDWETASIDNPSIDFFNSAWFLTDDIKEDKFITFVKEYFSVMKLEDDYNISVYAALIEECNWLAFSLKRSLKLITNNGYEIKLGEDSIKSSVTEIINYYNKIPLMLKLLDESK